MSDAEAEVIRLRWDRNTNLVAEQERIHRLSEYIRDDLMDLLVDRAQMQSEIAELKEKLAAKEIA